MGKFVSIDKQSKKQQKEYFAAQRCTWNGFDPVTRTVPNAKGYNRKKKKAEDRKNSSRSWDGCFFFSKF